MMLAYVHVVLYYFIALSMHRRQVLDLVLYLTLQSCCSAYMHEWCHAVYVRKVVPAKKHVSGNYLLCG